MYSKPCAAWQKLYKISHVRMVLKAPTESHCLYHQFEFLFKLYRGCAEKIICNYFLKQIHPSLSGRAKLFARVISYSYTEQLNA